MASRSSTHVAVEEGPRWDNLHPDCNRCVFQTRLVRSAKQQVISLIGGSLYTVASQRAPNTLQTDKGTEFLNRPLQKMLKDHGVHHFATHNDETKASIVERFNRTLKTRMWRFSRKTDRFDSSTSCRPLCDHTTTPITAVSAWLHQK